MAWAWLGLHCVAQKQGRSSESGTQFRTGTRSRRAPVLTSLHLSGWPINARSHPEVDLPGKLFLFFLDPVDASMLRVCACGMGKRYRTGRTTLGPTRRDSSLGCSTIFEEYSLSTPLCFSTVDRQPIRPGQAGAFPSKQVYRIRSKGLDAANLW